MQMRKEYRSSYGGAEFIAGVYSAESVEEAFGVKLPSHFVEGKVLNAVRGQQEFLGYMASDSTVEIRVVTH